MPKVCIVQYNASRFLTRVDRSARSLAEEGFDVVLIALKDADTPAYEERDGYTVKRVELASRRLTRRFGLKFVRFLEGIVRTTVAAYREDADVYNPRDAYPLLSAHVAALFRGAKVVYDSDELNLDRNWGPSRNSVWRFLMYRYERFLARRSALVVTSDYGRAEVLRERYGVDPVVVLNVPDQRGPIVPDASFREDVPGDGQYVLIYQGILVENRGLLELVDAMAMLPDCRLAIIGYGALEDRIAAAIERSGSGNIRLFPAMPFDRLMRCTAASDVGVIPLVGSCLSYRLAAPNKLFEFMAAGIPVVATGLEEMSRYVNEEDIGTLIAEPVTPESIAAAVRALIDGPEPLASVGARARRAFEERYNWDIEREKLLSAWRTAVAGGARA